MIRLITIFSAGFILVLFALFLFSHKIIERIIFRPTELDPSYVFSFNKPFEEFFITTEPGVNINVIKFPVKNPKGSILYFHGNKDNLVRWGEIASQFSDYKYNVYVFDYRGYGKSTGIPSETGILKDSELIFEKINQKYPDLHWVFYGRSLGTGIASYLSSKHTPNCLILEAPFYSMEDLIERFYFPYSWHDQKISFPSHQYIKNILCPVLILHGTNDWVVPLKQGQKLFDSLDKTMSKLVIIDQGSHNNLTDFKIFHLSIQAFLDKSYQGLGNIN